MTKSTLRALLSSVVALLLCLTMLIGTTFAWFTDTAATAVNIIQSGTLDVDLQIYEDGKWVTTEGKTLDFIAKDGNDNIRWEPGCTYDLPELRIVNNGNLALKYKVVITGIQGDAELNEVIEWTLNIDEDSVDTPSTADDFQIVDNTESYNINDEHSLAPEVYHTFTIKGHMKETAGNAYQGMEIKGISITVIATQDTVEYDSTTDDYDEDAEYPDVDGWTVVTTFDDLQDALYAGKNVKLGGNIIKTLDNDWIVYVYNGLYNAEGDPEYGQTIYATLDLNGYTLNHGIRVGNGGNLTVIDSRGTGMVDVPSNVYAIMVNPGTAIISGGTYNGVIKCGSDGTLSITGGTFSYDPSAYVADGYTVALGTDDKYIVAQN